jgi:hypothetical protein
LRDRVEALEKLVASIRKQIEGILNKMKGMSGGSDNSGLQGLSDELKKLRNEFNQHRDEAIANL